MIGILAKEYPNSVKERQYILHKEDREFGDDWLEYGCGYGRVNVSERAFEHKRFDNAYIVLTIETVKTKRTQQHYFRLIDFLELGEWVSAAHTGDINQFINYQRKAFDKLQKIVSDQCSKYDNLRPHIDGLVAFGEELVPLTPGESQIHSELIRKKEWIESQASKSRKANHSFVKMYEKVSCSGVIALPPVTKQKSMVCSSCVVGYIPNIDDAKPAWKIVIKDSFMPIIDLSKDKTVLDCPFELATIESRGLLLTTTNFYHIIKQIDMIVLRWIEEQL